MHLVEMRLAFGNMQGAFWEKQGAFWREFIRPGFLLRLAQLLIDEVNLAGGEAERAVAVGYSLEFGFQHGVGLHEALHLLACPHGGVALKVEAGQLGKSDGSHTGTPPLWARAFWMML